MLLSVVHRTDEELLTSGAPEDFAEFYRRNLEWVMGFLAHRTRDPELAADLCAEVFAAALTGRRRYRPDLAPARPWLHRIAVNKLTDALRRGAAEDRARRRLRLERIEPRDEDLRWIERLGERPEVLPLVDELPDDQRGAVRARIIEERAYDEIAGAEGVSAAVVRKRVSRGLSSVRRAMGAQR